MKVAVIGLDCADPRLTFEEFLPLLPNIRGLMERGAWGPVRSCDPPITVPAWQCFATSKNPGKLGFFGFRNRKGWGYDAERIATNLDVKEPQLWQVLDAAGKACICIGIPQTYPVKPLRHGALVSDFLTPDLDADYTWPKELKAEIKDVVGEYMFDVPDFRTDDKDRVLRDIYAMTDKRFRLAAHLLDTRPWDFFMMVEMGTDRIHHALWKEHDPEHPKHPGKGNRLEHAIRDYYVHVDGLIGDLLRHIPPDAAVIVMSDHGAKASKGTVCINDWLIREGYLALKTRASPDAKEAPAPAAGEVRTSVRPTAAVKFDPAGVDWSRTKAWGLGGYYGRVFMNVKGREPEGVIDPRDYEKERDALARRLEAMPGPHGKPLGNKAVKPQSIYTGPYTDTAPDLFVYFADLSFRATQSIGNPGVFATEAEIGPDEAVHDYHGIFILATPDGRLKGRHRGMTLYDGAPTILTLMGVPVPADMEGRPLDDKSLVTE